jgi:TFIIF-interacting CTD phosphatase-like protein
MLHFNVSCPPSARMLVPDLNAGLVHPSTEHVRSDSSRRDMANVQRVDQSARLEHTMRTIKRGGEDAMLSYVQTRSSYARSWSCREVACAVYGSPRVQWS